MFLGQDMKRMRSCTQIENSKDGEFFFTKLLGWGAHDVNKFKGCAIFCVLFIASVIQNIIASVIQNIIASVIQNIIGSVFENTYSLGSCFIYPDPPPPVCIHEGDIAHNRSTLFK